MFASVVLVPTATAIVNAALREGARASEALDRAEVWIDAVAASRGSARAARAVLDVRLALLRERVFLDL